MWNRLCCITELIVLVLFNLSCCPRVSTALNNGIQQVGTIDNEAVTEASGMVASRHYPGILWIHNDSGDRPRIYAINTHGCSLMTCDVTGARHRDWEDIAIGPGPDPGRNYLYIGDIGDNKAQYPYITVYRIPEPQVDPHALNQTGKTDPADHFTLVYPDGPRDAETLLVDPLNGDLYVISKRDPLSRVYYARHPLSQSARTSMELVAVLPFGFATGGDVSAHGRRIIIRGLYHGVLWERDPATPLAQTLGQPGQPIAIMAEPQGEAVCFDLAGTAYYTISEMKHSPVYYYKLQPKRSFP